MDYAGYVADAFRKLEEKFKDATLDRHEKRILKALFAVRPRVTPITQPHA